MHNSVLFTSLFSASAFLSYSALAACTANPDCAALGYTKSSCPSGDLVIKCPFNTAKVNCIPQTCESIGKKTCGDTCIKAGGCCSNADCAAGKVCDNYVCKEVLCAVGDIYYSDKTCSSTYNSSKKAIGVVGKISNGGKNGIVVEKNHSSSVMPWGCYGSDLSCITNKSGIKDGANPELRADYNGKANTACIVQNNCSYNGKTGAGVYCNNRNVEGVTGWYLPAGGELFDTMIEKRTTVNSGLSKIPSSQAIPSISTTIYYWSSSEHASPPTYGAWSWYFSYDGWFSLSKDTINSNYARCVLAF